MKVLSNQLFVAVIRKLLDSHLPVGFLSNGCCVIISCTPTFECVPALLESIAPLSRFVKPITWLWTIPRFLCCYVVTLIVAMYLVVTKPIVK